MSRQQAIEDRAIDWLIRRDEPDWSQEQQAELDAWLEASMAHKAAYWRADQGWREAGRIRSLGLNHAAADRCRARTNWWMGAVAASFAAMIVGAGALSLAPDLFYGPTTEVRQVFFDTPVGGHRLVGLEDGSKVELNTKTTVRTAFSNAKREVWLDRGEAYFEIAHRDGQPFMVHAGRQTVTVLGTKFSVRRDRDRVTVNVLDGRVRVDDGKGDLSPAAIITAGDTVISRGPSILIAPKSEERVKGALAWRGGMLIFNQSPLGEVASEFNRYNRTQLRVVDSAAAQIPIGGTFQASNVDAFVRLLRDAYNLRIQQNDNRVEISI